MEVPDDPVEKPGGESELTKAVTSNISDAMLIVSDGVIQFANEAAGKMLGVALASDLIGCKHLMFVHPAYHQSVRDARAILKAGGTPPPQERMMVRGDGKPIWVEVVATRMAVKGEPVLLLLTDISDHGARTPPSTKT